MASTSPLTTPISELAADSPLALPTVTPLPPPIIPAPTRFTSSSQMYSSTYGEVTGTPIPADSQVLCAPQGDLMDCYDILLDMRFSYPAFMGTITYTSLQPGHWAGFGYEYLYDDSSSFGGGRSANFSTGRGPRYTDQMGFNGQSAAEICARWAAAMCQELAPGIIHIVILPQAEWLCSDAMMFQPIPRSILALDLPQHPFIQGFAFSISLLSTDAEAAFNDMLYGSERDCTPDFKAEFGQEMEQLSLDLEAGTAEVGIQARYDAMFQLAESIASPYLATQP